MKFTTTGSKIVEYEGKSGTVSLHVPRGTTFAVEGKSPIDMSGRTISKETYKKYFAPPKPEPEPVAEPKQEEE